VPEASGGAVRAAPWRRHDLLHVAPPAWSAALAAFPPPGTAAPLLEGWADRGWPVIVRRRMAGEAAGAIPIGVPLPPAAGKCRIAMSLPGSGVINGATPPLLQDVARAAPTPHWQHIVSALVRLGKRYGIRPLVFGSLMWQHQTGLPYLHPGSDLDVLWPVSSDCDIASLVSGVAEIEGNGTPHIDGEIVFPDGSAVNWRELLKALRLKAAGKLLVKDMGSVRLVDLACLLGRG
jgi:phosphoribosyl-dephospho-CoA transferase